MSNLFLNNQELRELTGITRGREGKTVHQLRCEHLRRIGIAFYENIRGEPKVPISQIEAVKHSKTPTLQHKWKPKIA